MLDLSGTEFLSTIPLTRLVQALQPHAPAEVRATAARSALSRSRDRGGDAQSRARDRSDLDLLSEKDIPFGRLHEPTNWKETRPWRRRGRTLLVTERFCFRGDTTWNAADAELIGTTVARTSSGSGSSGARTCDGTVVRIPAAYPLFEVGYQARTRCCAITSRVSRTCSSPVAADVPYYNMDHAIASGLDAAEAILRRDAAPLAAARPEARHECALIIPGVAAGRNLPRARPRARRSTNGSRSASCMWRRCCVAPVTRCASITAPS